VYVPVLCIIAYRVLSVDTTFPAVYYLTVQRYSTCSTVTRCSLRLEMTSELDTAIASGRGMDWNNPPVPPPDSWAAFKSASNFSTWGKRHQPQLHVNQNQWQRSSLLLRESVNINLPVKSLSQKFIDWIITFGYSVPPRYSCNTNG
jgi:hypothetical protein